MATKKQKIRSSSPRQKSVRKEALRHRSGAIAGYDEAVSILADIRTLAGLLEATGVRRGTEPLDATLVSMTGSLIARHVDQLHSSLKTSLDKTLSLGSRRQDHL